MEGGRSVKSQCPFISCHLFQDYLGFSLNLRARMQEALELCSDPARSGTESRRIGRKPVAMKVRAQTDADERHRPKSGE